MTRIELHYGGRLYTMGDATLEDAQARVAETLATEPHWLEVDEGEGDVRTAYLLLTSGVALAIGASE